jgi:hypothetical protein
MCTCAAGNHNLVVIMPENNELCTAWLLAPMLEANAQAAEAITASNTQQESAVGAHAALKTLIE